MADKMPPLGPPYGPAGPPPPPRFPERPPTEWGPRPIEDVPAPPMPPPNDSRRRLAVIAGIIAAAVLLIGAVTVARSDDTKKTARPRNATTSTAPGSNTDSSDASSSGSQSSDSSATASTGSQQLQQVVADIERFVERERGLKFKADVPVELLDGNEFNTELFKGFEEEQPAIVEQAAVLKALGLVAANRDLVADERELLSIGVEGFYDQKTKRLVVRGTDTTPLIRKVLAHELTHALDDQWFNLDRPELDTADDESSFGFSALVEGNARVIEQAYYDKELTSDEQQQSDAAEQEITTSAPQIFSLPLVLLVLLQAPYDSGTTLVQRLEQASASRLDEAFANPPLTSEQVIEPDKYLAGEGAVGVADPPPADGSVPVYRGALGVLLLQQLLADGHSIDVTSIDDALKGWGGDRYVTWTDAGRTCIDDVVVGDDATATGTLLQRFQDWASSPGVTATVAPLSTEPGSPFAITTCSL
ncbi:MAG: hypothetical protein ACR2LQ_13270 [Acidimicrobiales bacterium]